jgi:hypothetical protein
MATTNTLVGKNGHSYKITEKNKVKKVTSLADMKKLDVNLKEDYHNMNLTLYRYFKEQDENSTSWKKTHVLYRDYKINYSETGIKVIDVRNFNRPIDVTKLDPFPAPIEIYLYMSKLGMNKQVLKDKKMQATNEKPVNSLLKEISKVLKMEEHSNRVITRLVVPLYLQLNAATDIEQSVIKHYKKLMETKFMDIKLTIKPVEEVKVEEPVIDLVDLRKKFVAKITRCKDVKAVIAKIQEELVPHKGFKIMVNKLVRAYEAKELRMPKFKNEVIALAKNDAVFAEKLKPAPKFVERSPIIIEELLSVEGNVITFKRKHTQYTVSKLEMYATDLLSAEPRAHVAIHKMIHGQMTPEEFIVNPVVVDKTICLDYQLLKNHKLTPEQETEVTNALEDVLLQWEMQNPLHFVYKNMADYKIGTKMKVYYRDLFTYKVGIIHKYEGGYKIRYEDGEINFLLQHQEIKIVK